MMARQPQNAGILIVGLGRPRHGDDAIGLNIVADLDSRLRGVARCVADPSGWGLLDAIDGVDLLILVDAAQAHEALPAGSWRRIDYHREPSLLADSGLRGTHSADLASILEMARALGTLPENVWIYAVAGDRFEPESEPSEAVMSAAEAVREDIWNLTGLA